MPQRGFIDEKGQKIDGGDVIAGKGVWKSYPRSLVQALARQRYEKYCDVSASFIAGGLVQQEMLRQRHDFWVKVDDVMYQAFGSAWHLLMERRPDGSAVERKRYCVKLSLPRRDAWVTVGGTFDELNVEEVGKKHRLLDYKTAAVFKAKKILSEGLVTAAPEWCRQLNVYLWLMLTAEDSPFRSTSRDAWELFVFLFSRDWRGYEATKSKKGYPKWGQFFEVPVEEERTVRDWIEEVADSWLVASSLTDDKLPECPEDQLWNGKRCAQYCEVAEFCQQRKRQLMQSGDGGTGDLEGAEF